MDSVSNQGQRATHGSAPADLAAEFARRGDALFSQGNLPDALRHFAAAMAQQPQIAEYAYRVGVALWRLGSPPQAKKLFEQAVALQPDFAQAHGELGRVLLAMGDMQPARFHAQKAVELDRDNPTLQISLAAVFEADRQTGEASAIVDQLISRGVENVDLAMVFARLAAKTARESEALALIDRQLRQVPPLNPAEESALRFAAANLLDRLGRYDEAFAHASTANRLRGSVYDPIATSESFENFMGYFSRATIARFSRPARVTKTPVFIVGMPRSGTSLVEQILASHPAVHGAGELNWIAGIFESALNNCARGQTPTLQSLDHLSASEIDALSADYLDRLQALNPPSRYITDKMPTNFIYLGLIAILFPGAKVIHCRRAPLDTCLSCFMTDFAGGYEFSFSLEGCGHFYRQYQRLMAHWQSTLDLSMLDVDYENLVADVEGETRRLLAFLDLPWDETCLRFFETRRFVATASHGQVSRPVYQSSVGRWKHYGRFLGPARDSLPPG